MFGIIGSLLGAAWKGLTGGGKSSTASKMAYRHNWSLQARGGTDAAVAFANITNAHCEPEDIVDEFGIDTEDWGEPDPELGMTPWDYAYQELLEELGPIAEMLDCDPEELIEEYIEELEEMSFDYACDWVDRMMTGMEWIPDEGDMLDWAFYDVSDHNY